MLRHPEKFNVNIYCSVAAVQVTNIVSRLDGAAQSRAAVNIQEQSLTKAIHLYRNSQMDRLTGNYDVTYRACTMTDREGQTD